MSHRYFIGCLVLLFSTSGLLAQSLPDAVKAPAKPKDASDQLFEGGKILKLRIEVAPDQVQKLREKNREFVKATIVEEGGATYKDVGIKLKGAAGSFRGFDDRPALTVSADKYIRQQVFHDLEKFHLNNSVQDESYLNELIASDIFRAAGYPATRVTHARVWLNGRDLGLYVLKEGFDKRFLGRYFAKTNGNLYDGGFCQDIDAQLEKDSGNGVDDRSDVKAIVDACREGDPQKRFEKLTAVLDTDAMATFVAIELLTCHWDGYCKNVNNYRVYFEPTTKKAYFFPHGMDQMFGDTGTPIADYPRGMASNAIMQNPVMRAKYLDRVSDLIAMISPPDKLQARCDEIQKRLEPVLTEIHPDRAKQHADRVREVKERIKNRAQNLVEQRARLPVKFDAQGVAKLVDWTKQAQSGDAKVELVDLPGGRKAYSIECGPSNNVVASWRRKALLTKGKYRLEALVATRDIVPQGDPKGSGVGLRVSGGMRGDGLSGTSGGQQLAFDFVVNEDQREVELVAEMKATKGQVWFAADSLQLRRVP